MLPRLKSAFLPLCLFSIFGIGASQYSQKNVSEVATTQPVPSQCTFPTPQLQEKQSATEEVIYFVNCGGFF